MKADRHDEANKCFLWLMWMCLK